VARPKFIADADFNEKVIRAARRREPAIDFLDASDGGTRGLSDPEVLALAAATGRIVVSSDRKTMPGHFWRFVETHQSPGVIIVPQSIQISSPIEELIAIWKEVSNEELRNRIRWLRRRS
jgi:predicted nuclease of predicted toxin-antitoxin system